MATTTTNYGLTKPSYGDNADIAVINSNMDKIDAKMKEIENASGGGGGGASAWSDISDKPFESIGNGLEVDENGVMSATGDTVDAYTKGQTDNLLRNKVDNGIISDEWNSATTYEVGQYCIYNNSLWKCILQHNGQTPEDGTYWTKVSIGSEFNTLNSNFSDIGSTHLLMHGGYSDGSNVDISNLSIYKTLTFIAIWDNSQFLNCITIPLSAYNSFYGGLLRLSLPGDNYIEIRPVSDNQIHLKCSSTYLKLRVFGSK